MTWVVPVTDVVRFAVDVIRSRSTMSPAVVLISAPDVEPVVIAISFVQIALVDAATVPCNVKLMFLVEPDVT